MIIADINAVKQSMIPAKGDLQQEHLHHQKIATNHEDIKPLLVMDLEVPCHFTWRKDIYVLAHQLNKS